MSACFQPTPDQKPWEAMARRVLKCEFDRHEKQWHKSLLIGVRTIWTRDCQAAKTKLEAMINPPQAPK